MTKVWRHAPKSEEYLNIIASKIPKASVRAIIKETAPEGFWVLSEDDDMFEVPDVGIHIVCVAYDINRKDTFFFKSSNDDELLSRIVTAYTSPQV